jgi:ABC-type lipoprotein release transport system permease subunit
VSKLDNYLIKGNFFTEKNNNAVIIGEQLAEKLHADVHSKITITMQDYNGNYIKQDVTVEGIYKLSNSEFNEQMMFMNKQDLQKVISFPDGNISTINILLNDDADTKQVQDDIKKQYTGMQVQSWQELSPMLQVMSGTVSQMTSIFVFIILLALSFSIINNMLMAVMDRTREIGMLLCIGMSRRKVFGMIVLETLFLSLTGAMLGLVISITTIYYFGKKGIDLSFISEGINAIGYSSHVYPVIDNDFYLQFACMVIFIALVSSFFPAKRAVKLNPAEAVRGE